MPVPDWSMIGMTITAGKLIGNHIIQSVQSVQYKCTECTAQVYRVYITNVQSVQYKHDRDDNHSWKADR